LLLQNTGGSVGVGAVTFAIPSGGGNLLQVGAPGGAQFHLEVAGQSANANNPGNIYLGQGINTGEAGMSLNTFGSIGNGAYTTLDNSAASGWSVMCAGSPVNGIDYFKISRAPPTAGVPAFATLLTLTSGGNLGIGVGPTDTGGFGRAIDVSGPDGSAYYARSVASGTYTAIGQYSTASGTAYFINTGTTMLFNNNGSERMRIDSSGNLFVACTTFPSASVYGLAYITSGGTNGYLSNSISSTGAASQIIFGNANGTVGSISTSGSLTSYNVSSDYRLKENIAPMTGALATVAQLKPVTYKWKVDGSDGQGFIAHELAEVVPNCVTGEKDAVDENGKPIHQGIDTSFLVATLTKAIQEQQAQIESLTATVAAQAQTIAAIQQQLGG